jgi:hypothetical protein
MEMDKDVQRFIRKAFEDKNLFEIKEWNRLWLKHLNNRKLTVQKKNKVVKED